MRASALSLFALVGLGPVAHAQLPGAFVENAGQWPDEVLYHAALPGQDVWVTRAGLVHDAYRLQGAAEAAASRRKGCVVRLQLDGGRWEQPRGRSPRPGRIHFLREPGVAHHATVFDAVEVGLENGRPLVLTAEPEGLQARFALSSAADAVPEWHADEAELALRAGTLEAHSGCGTVPLMRLATGPEERSTRRRTTRPDGPLSWSTLLGPAGIVDAAPDPSGRLVVAGRTGIGSFPATAGAYDVELDGLSDVFVARLASDGSAIEWATLLGGDGIEEADAVAVRPDGRVVVAGRAIHSSFPVTPGAYDTESDGVDLFIAELSAEGAALEWATYFGGNTDPDGDGAGRADLVWSLALGEEGEVLVGGSAGTPDFPTTFGPASPDDFTGFFSALAPDGSQLRWSTLLAGTAGVTAIASDERGAVGVGLTDSTGFVATPGAYGEGAPDSRDAFAVRVAPDGTGLAFAARVGGSGRDGVTALHLRPDGALLLGGTSWTGDFLPGAPGAYVAQLSPDGRTLDWATRLGGSGTDHVIAVGEGQGGVVVAGSTVSLDFPTTPGAYDDSVEGEADLYVARLSADGSATEYASVLGGGGEDWLHAAAVDPEGGVMLFGATSSPDFPTTPGVMGEEWEGGPFGFEQFASRFELPRRPVAAEGAPPPVALRVAGPFPHPIQTESMVRVVLPEAATLRAELYDVLGRRVRVLADTEEPAGEHRLDLSARGLSSGLYLLRVEAGAGAVVRRVVVNR